MIVEYPFDQYIIDNFDAPNELVSVKCPVAVTSGFTIEFSGQCTIKNPSGVGGDDRFLIGTTFHSYPGPFPH